MKLDENKNTNIANLFRNSNWDGNYFEVIYWQRDYRWGVRRLSSLLDDIHTAYLSDTPEEPFYYFLHGIIVCDVSTHATGDSDLQYICDGQQRLISLSLLIKTIENILGEQLAKLPPMPVAGDDPNGAIRDNINNYLNAIKSILTNFPNKVKNPIKILPRIAHAERETYFAIMNNTPLTNFHNRVMIDAYEYIDKSIRSTYPNNVEALGRLFRIVTTRLMFSEEKAATLDEAAKMYKSVNTDNEITTPGEAIRAMFPQKVTDSLSQQALYDATWGTIENTLYELNHVGNKNDGPGEISAFLKYYLNLRSMKLHKEKDMYTEFREWVEENAPSDKEFLALMYDMTPYASYFDKIIRPDHESDRAISSRLKTLAIFDLQQAYPFVLKIYSELDHKRLTQVQFVRMLDYLINYFARRSLLPGVAKQEYMFCTLWDRIQTTADPVTRLSNELAAMGYPNDEELKNSLLFHDVGGSTKSIRYILSRVNTEIYPNADTVPCNDLTVEHILPQMPDEKEWSKYYGNKSALKEFALRYTYSIGNLTLLKETWNSSLKNGPFADKLRAFRESTMPINSMYFSGVTKWKINDIKNRILWISALIVKIFPEMKKLPSTDPKATADSKHMTGTLLIGDRTISVSKWNDIQQATFEACANKVGIDAIMVKFPKLLREKSQAVGNRAWTPIIGHDDYYIRANRSEKSCLRICRRLLRSSNLEDMPWEPRFKMEQPSRDKGNSKVHDTEDLFVSR